MGVSYISVPHAPDHMMCILGEHSHVSWPTSIWIQLGCLLLSVRVNIIDILLTLIMLWDLLLNMGLGLRLLHLRRSGSISIAALAPTPSHFVLHFSMLCLISPRRCCHDRSVMSNTVHVLVRIWNNQKHMYKSKKKKQKKKKLYQHILGMFGFI